MVRRNVALAHALALSRGSASAEYLITSALVVAVMFTGSPNLAEVLMQAVRIAYARYVFSLGLP